MARAATTTDVFNAVAEPRRREILTLLSRNESSVNSLVASTALSQPQVSKHLRVLRAVGLVTVRDAGRQRLYRIDAQPLRDMHEWLSPFEQLWAERFDALDAVLEKLKEEQ